MLKDVSDSKRINSNINDDRQRNKTNNEEQPKEEVRNIGITSYQNYSECKGGLEIKSSEYCCKGLHMLIMFLTLNLFLL